ncbi:MAG: MotA/TolQ/ExbB proton channel family protein [Thermodesulfobacteriota bacterium]
MLLPDLLQGTLDYLKAGGGVIVPLVIISVWMWSLILGKWLQLYRNRNAEIPIRECLEKFRKGYLVGAPWQQGIMQIYQGFRESGLKPDANILAVLRRKYEEEIERSTGTILVLAAIAPLLGLLGTVAGMVTTFDVIAKFGTGDAKAMASGISEALLTTQTGLVVAVPGLVMGNFLKRRVESVKGRMERFCLGLLRDMGVEAVVNPKDRG